MGGRVVPAQVHLDDGVPLLGRHLQHRAVAQDPGVVDQRVQAAQLLQRDADDGLRHIDLRAVPRVQHRPPAAGADLLDNGGTGGLVDLTHDDICTLARQLERLPATQAASRTRDDRDLAVQQSHGCRTYPGLAAALLTAVAR